MKWLAAILVMATLSSPAFSAGITSRNYTCATLHALIMARGFVFIGNPDFEDFVVANASYCSDGQIVQLRSVETSDNPDCPVNYCISPSAGSGGGN
jgi:hypothetical protein